jgi:hypothetical protein
VQLDAALAKVDEYKPKSDLLDGKWKGYAWPASDQAEHNPDTGVAKDVLIEVGKASVTLPEGFVSGSLGRAPCRGLATYLIRLFIRRSLDLSTHISS